MGSRPPESPKDRNIWVTEQKIVEIKPAPSQYSQLIEGFLASADAKKIIIPGFDWQEWSSTVEAQQLCQGGSAVERASRADLSKLVTLLVRSERFVEGTLEEAARSGLLSAIAKRLNFHNFTQ